jgi:quinol monooxygenase YgiN
MSWITLLADLHCLPLFTSTLGEKSFSLILSQVDKVAKMCKDILDYSHGRQANRSNGIHEFAVSRDQFESNVFYLWERYESNVDMGRHNSTTEFKAFMENVRL